MIDIADLQDFLDAPWLWEACWRDNYLAVYGEMMMSGEGLLLGESFTEPENPFAQMSDLDALKLARDLIELHDFIGESIDWTDKKKEKEDLLNAMYSLEYMIYEIYWARE